MHKAEARSPNEFHLNADGVMEQGLGETQHRVLPSSEQTREALEELDTRTAGIEAAEAAIEQRVADAKAAIAADTQRLQDEREAFEAVRADERARFEAEKAEFARTQQEASNKKGSK